MSDKDAKQNENDQEKQNKLKEKEIAAYEKDPEAATKRGQEDAYERMKEGLKASGGLKEDINSMVHPDKDDAVDARGSGKAGVPAGTEDYEKNTAKALKSQDKDEAKALKAADKDDKTPSDHSPSKAPPVTKDPADGGLRTADGVKAVPTTRP